MDAGLDAGERDAGERDAGPPDAARPPTPDSGPPDAGPVDAGPPPVLTVTGGLVVHFDAQDVAGDASDPGPAPATWVDLTGGNDAACENVVYDPDGLAVGRPAILTSGEAGSRCEFPIPNFDNAVSIFVVLRTGEPRSTASWHDAPVIVGGNRTGDHEDAAMYMSGGRIGFGRGSAGPQFVTTTTYHDGAPHVAGLVRVSNTGAVRLTVDRALTALGAAETGRIRDPDHWWLASHEIAADGRFAARYAEVLVYSRELSLVEAADVQSYLLRRWGL
jgi:hypothetical protein